MNSLWSMREGGAKDDFRDFDVTNWVMVLLFLGELME